MKDEIQQERIRAVHRFLNDEKPESICASLGRSKAWLYKWVGRHTADDKSLSENQSRRPLSLTSRTPKEIEEIVKMVRLNLYNRDLFCGAQAILWEMEELEVRPLPSPQRRSGFFRQPGVVLKWIAVLLHTASCSSSQPRS